MDYQLDGSLAPETAQSLDPFTRAYIEAALWTLTDEDGESLDHLGLHDLHASTLAAAREDCADFQASYGEQIAGREAQAGHDFWLTRNRHGAGFWDGDWPAPLDQQLTEAAHAYGEADWYLGDDGYIYQY